MTKHKEEKTNVMRLLEQKKVPYTAHACPHDGETAPDGVTVAAMLGGVMAYPDRCFDSYIGFILGTLPDLWQDAGKQGRSPGTYLALALGLAFIVGMLFLFKTKLSVEVAPNFLGFILCGVLWGLSFIVPGLSSSSLLLFFGLYQPMLGGISTLDFRVIAPMALGMIACVLLFSKGVGLAYKRFYAVVSHALIGVVLGSTLMILPPLGDTAAAVALSVLCIAGGAAFSFFFTWLCNRIKAKPEG